MNHPARFQPGCTPGPGRPKGSVSGRTKAIALIDDLLTKYADKLEEALEAELLKNPARFWTRYGLPLVPQAMVARVETTQTQGSPWISLLEAARLREVERRAQAAGLELPPTVQRVRPGGWGQDADEG
ncbi:MAG: hypothetical protein PHI39_03495 [Kiritimatiellae bacterium]|nr:hypothetical protein [Kiritimatiellia bacterium]